MHDFDTDELETDDPIAELLRDLAESGRPSLTWVVRWSADGSESVAAAWAACRDPHAMLWLLGDHDGQRYASKAYLDAQRRVDRARRVRWIGLEDEELAREPLAAEDTYQAASDALKALEPAEADALRRVVPPDLATLIAAYDR